MNTNVIVIAMAMAVLLLCGTAAYALTVRKLNCVRRIALKSWTVVDLVTAVLCKHESLMKKAIPILRYAADVKERRGFVNDATTARSIANAMESALEMRSKVKMVEEVVKNGRTSVG